MWKSCLAAVTLFFCLCGPALAHFGMVIPSTSTVEDKKSAALRVEFSFSHPMAMVGMPLARPKAVLVYREGKVENITGSLKAAKVMGHEAWQAAYTIKKPGLYHFVMEPQPYWEPAEDCFIIHYSKTSVAAFGEEDGWDEPLGLKTEIVPLTRPFGNYAGNVFQGRVLLDGRPVPHAEVEVEYYNRERKYAAPNEYMITQVIRADADGVFTYGIPFAGWWGFSALNTAAEKIPHQGVPKEVELGAVLWLEFVAPLAK